MGGNRHNRLAAGQSWIDAYLAVLPSLTSTIPEAK